MTAAVGVARTRQINTTPSVRSLKAAIGDGPGGATWPESSERPRVEREQRRRRPPSPPAPVIGRPAGSDEASLGANAASSTHVIAHALDPESLGSRIGVSRRRSWPRPTCQRAPGERRRNTMRESGHLLRDGNSEQDTTKVPSVSFPLKNSSSVVEPASASVAASSRLLGRDRCSRRAGMVRRIVPSGSTFSPFASTAV